MPLGASRKAFLVSAISPMVCGPVSSEGSRAVKDAENWDTSWDSFKILQKKCTTPHYQYCSNGFGRECPIPPEYRK